MKIHFVGLGWKSKLMLKRATYTISINKLVAEGNRIEKGDELYCYLIEDSKKRIAVIIYLDGKKREKQ